MVEHFEEIDKSCEHELSSLTHIGVPEQYDKFDVADSPVYGGFE